MREAGRPSADRGEANGPAARPVWPVLVAIVAIGAGLRLAELPASLWYDEIAAYRDYGTAGPVAALTNYWDPANHVAHTALTAVTVPALTGVLGETFALRLPAFVFSLLAVPAVYLLTRSCASRRAGLVAAALAAFAPVAVLEGTEARGYSMMIAAAATATWTFVRMLDAPGRRWLGWSAVYALAVTIGIWAHLMTVFVAVGHAAWLVGDAIAPRGRRAFGRGAVALGLGAFLTLAAYAPIVDDILRAARRFGGGPDVVLSPFGREGLDALLQLGGSWAWWAALPGLLLALLGARCAAGDPVARRTAVLALAGLPIMLAAVLAARTWMYARFTLFALPGAILLVALGLETLRTSGRRRWSGALAILIVAFLCDLALRPPRQPLREAAMLVRTTRTQNEPVLVIGLRHRVMDVYAEDLRPAHSLLHGEDLPEKLDAVRPTWIIMLYPDSVPVERHELLARAGFETFRRLPGWIDGGNGEVRILRRRRAPGQRH